MAVNRPVGDNARKGAVRKRTQLKTKTMGEKHWTKRSKGSGQFMDPKEGSRASGGRNEPSSASVLVPNACCLAWRE